MARKQSPTSRSLQECKRRGWRAQVVEHWNQFARRRVDLFGCVDIVVCLEGQTIGIQATTMSNKANRIQKIRGEARDGALAWIRGGNRLQVWCWRPLKVKRGGKAIKWECDETEIHAEDLQ